MKRTIPDCSMEWGYLDEGPQANITNRTDLMTTARLARGVVSMRKGIKEDKNLPFDLPCLLHSDPDAWPLDRDQKGIDASLMPLDKPSIGAYVHAEEEGPSMKHWVGSMGEWIAFVQHPGPWYIENSYRNVDIPLPPVERVGINPILNDWLPRIPFSFRYKLTRIELLKIQITRKPIMRGEEWHFSAIAVFDKFIAVIHKPHDTDWIILRNDYLAPARYVDAIATNMYGEEERIYAVTTPRGDVLVWELFKWGADAGPRVIPAPMLEEEPANGQAGGGVGDDASSSWYLVPMPNTPSIMWIHSSGERRDIGGPISYKGRVLSSYHPSVRCHVFTRSTFVLDDPVAPDWIRADNLGGKSVFVGINYPFFFDAPATSSEPDDDAVNEHAALPVFKPDCVFATHVKCQQYPQPSPDWIRMPVNDGGPTAIGSSLNYEHRWRPAETSALMYETPMWFVPTLPRIQ